MWINDVERESVGVDVKSVEFTVDCVAGDSAVTGSERTSGHYICHPSTIL